IRRSLLYSIASRTNASSTGSLNDASHPSATAEDAACCAVHRSGVFTLGKAWVRNSSVGGGWLSAHPATTSEPRTMTVRAPRMPSVQLEDQVVHVRADADDHAPHDLNDLEMLRVDRSVADRASGEKQLAIAVGDVELDRKLSGRLIRNRRHWKRPARKQLALAHRPYDRIDLALDDASGVRIERKLGFVVGLHAGELVLRIECNDLPVGFDERHDRIEWQSCDEATRAQLQVDHVAVAWRTGQRFTEIPFRRFQLRADLRHLRELAFHLRAELLSDLLRGCNRLQLRGAGSCHLTIRRRELVLCFRE